MWLSRRNPNPRRPHRARRSFLLVEKLEKRELLSGTPQPVSAPQSPYPAFPGLSAPVPADPLLSGQSLPGDIAGLSGGNLPGPSWQSVGQSAAGLFGSGLPQKAPANAKGPLLQIPLVVGPNQSSSPSGEGYTPA